MNDIEPLLDSGKSSTPYVFCVADGGYIGMVPHLSRVGDTICLIHGLEVPYVLRDVRFDAMQLTQALGLDMRYASIVMATGGERSWDYGRTSAGAGG
ncbi:hypothetical protein QBC46DRAFT_401377 [Diplogelasinospora grovesii]|uniref:Uncharacterized protein n=1 Tax=Diplogelasinospora grovesii TaxID=303347 RepID=A0AAN6RYC8_9PEZI|nr:hypothetical protein QBC46DRAFT_401377 [Diplogelasinospora grovesii]